MPDKNEWDDALEQMKQVEEKLQKQSQQGKSKPTTDEASHRNATVYVMAGFLALLTIGGLAFVILSGGGTPEQPAIPDAIEADPAQFDPQISLETVQRFAGENVRFLSLQMTRVHPDGTVDFSADDKPIVEYTFLTTDEREQVIVSVAEDLSLSRTTESLSPGLSFPIRVEPPTCDIPKLWQLAKSYNAPNEGLADINYDASGYRFVIASLEIDLQFNGDCILIRS